MDYVASENRMLIFGGGSGPPFPPTNLTDTWAYEVETATWSELTTETAPQLEANFTGAYDGQSEKFIVFGRGVESGESETWAFDYATTSWVNMSPASGPDLVHPGDAVYSPALDRVLIYGGNPDWPNSTESVDDLWAYDYEGNSWVKLAQE